MGIDHAPQDRPHNTSEDKDTRYDAHVFSVLAAGDEARGNDHDHRVNTRRPDALECTKDDATIG